MTGEAAGVAAGRVAEIIVTRHDNTVQRGSGYLVRTGRVLTVHHVLAGARRVEVRVNADRPGERRVDATVLWSDASCDAAVLGVSAEMAAAPASFARVAPGGGRVDFRTVGFPAFKLRDDPNGLSQYRDLHDANGHIAPLSNRREGTLELVMSTAPARVDTPPRQGMSGASDREGTLRRSMSTESEQAAKSLWQGMSGAAVWVGGRIVGLVSRHHRSDGPGVLAAVRVDAWAEQLADPRRLAELEGLLGTRLGINDLAPARPEPEETRLPGPARVVLATPPGGPMSPGPTWRGGEEITVGDHTYLLLDGHIDSTVLTRSPLRIRQAQALRIVGAGRSASTYAWLRQTEILGRSAWTACGPIREDVDEDGALSPEYRILNTIRPDPGLPTPEHFVVAGRSETLVLAWPTGPTGEPCPTLRQRYGAEGPLDLWRLGRVINGISGLCGALARLHTQERAHRALTSDAIIVRAAGSFTLRDLGFAARRPRRGEGSGSYQAPEQRLNQRGSSPPGPTTDVYQLAAIIYHLTTGRVPMHGTPLPAASVVPDTPPPLGKLLDTVLRAEAASRPTAAEFGAALADVHDQLV